MPGSGAALQMTKIIYCIKSGRNIGLGNHELYCISTWKKTYPDFTIRYVTDDEVFFLIQDCPYIADTYQKGIKVFAVDYARLKLLYQYGGMYLDTDVVALHRIPDSYFNKAFLSWQSSLGSCWTNNGTVCYTEPHNPLFQEFLDFYRAIPVSENLDTVTYANHCIDEVLKKHGLITSPRRTISLHDQELENIRILNWPQFGLVDCVTRKLGTDRMGEGERPYLMHCYMNSWLNELDARSNIYYDVLSDDTDLDQFSQRLDVFIRMIIDETAFLGTSYVLFINSIKGQEKEFIDRLFSEIPVHAYKNKHWHVLYLGDNLSPEIAQDCINDLLLKRFRSIKMVHQISQEDI